MAGQDVLHGRASVLSMNPGNIQQPTSNTQHPLTNQGAATGCSMLVVGCWMFSAFGSGVQRVKNALRGILSPKAWEPARSLKLQEQPFAP